MDYLASQSLIKKILSGCKEYLRKSNIKIKEFSFEKTYRSLKDKEAISRTRQDKGLGDLYKLFKEFSSAKKILCHPMIKKYGLAAEGL